MGYSACEVCRLSAELRSSLFLHHPEQNNHQSNIYERDSEENGQRAICSHPLDQYCTD